MDYRKNVCDSAKKVYEKVVELQCKHKSGVYTYDDIKEKKIVNCSGAVSAALKLAGCMTQGMVTHTTAVGSDVIKKKNTVEKSMNGRELTTHIKWIYVGKAYDQLPDAYKKEGIIYVQDSNICINAGDGYIWSCNCTDDVYTKMSKVKKNNGYVKASPILVVGVPEKIEEKKTETTKVGKKIIDIYHAEGISKYDELCDATHFIIHKGCQGLQMVDDKCEARIKAFEERQHPYWIYVYLNKGDELAQTKRMVSLYKEKVGKHFVGYVIDIEEGNSQDNCLSALEYLLKLNHKVMFYFAWGSAGKYPKLIAKRSDKCAYWECRYGDTKGNEAGTDRSSKYPFHSYADIGQYTDHGTCSGMIGKNNIDLNKLTGTKPLTWFTTPYKVPEKKKGETYKGEFPALPPRGYWMIGDGKTSYANYPTQIERLQEFLAWAGFYIGSIKGFIGQQCRQAIIDFQEKVGLKQDGLFGADCLKAAKEYVK